MVKVYRYPLSTYSLYTFFQHSSGNEDMILSKETVEEMFKHDMTFAANQVVDPKDLR